MDNKVHVGANDEEGRRQLARYMIRNPFSLEKMDYKDEYGVVVYRSKLHATLKRNFQIMPGAAWLKFLLRHVPDRGEHLVRYYGWYTNRSRGERKAIESESTVSIPTPSDETIEPDTEFSQVARSASEAISAWKQA